jgi:hypothetical protein
MNKIERAIYDVKNHIKDLEKEKIIIETKIEAFEDMLINLESIEISTSIPYINKQD